MVELVHKDQLACQDLQVLRVGQVLLEYLDNKDLLDLQDLLDTQVQLE
jgi:hypothetical protein